MTDQLPAPWTPTSDDIAVANLYANATAALPESYRKNPGAILLAQEWGRRFGLDTLTVIQNVSFYEGKPIIDATMQRALAAHAGYRVSPLEHDEKSATVQVTVIATGEVLGTSTYTIEDAATANLLNKNNWKNHPKNMLVARASTNAIRFYCPEVTAGVYTRDELDDHATDVPPIPPAQTADSDTTADDGIEDAEVVEPAANVDDGGLHLLLTAVKGLDSDAKTAFRAERDTQGWAKKPKDMTADEIAEALDWIEANV